MRRTGKNNKKANASSLAEFSALKVEEKIRQRAYELYEARGRDEGHELDDWLQAESEIKGQKIRASAV